MKSIMPFDVSTCIECGGPAHNTHHCIFGKNRKHSEEYGLKVRMCYGCHYRLHNQDEDLAMKYRRMAQEYFEKTHTREEFRRIFGRSYL